MKPIILFTASLVALAGSAAAQLPGPGGPPTFSLLEFDANADGKLTKSEFEAGQRARFNQFDGNKDGSATPEEIITGREVQAKAHREAAQKERFAELDKDKNGQLSQAEFLTTAEPRGGRGERIRLSGGPDFDLMPGPGGAPPGARGPGAPGRPPLVREGRQMAVAPGDADRDGKLTFAEFSARGNEAFARADANKDGTVTIAELQARSR
jgi:hypothetical protein